MLWALLFSIMFRLDRGEPALALRQLEAAEALGRSNGSGSILSRGSCAVFRRHRDPCRRPLRVLPFTPD